MSVILNYMLLAAASPAELYELTAGEFFVAGGREYGFGELYGRYEASELGRHHFEQPLRYAVDFGYGTRRQMLTDLPPDIHPVTHMEINHRDLSALLMRYVCIDTAGILHDLTPEDIIAGRFASLVHDTGENTSELLIARCGAVVGDIPHGKKTPEDKAKERNVLETVMDMEYRDLPEWLLQRSVNIITHTEQSLIHAWYEISHDFGVYATGLAAGNLALSLLDDEHGTHRFQQLRRIATEVTVRARHSLERQADEFPAVRPSLDISQRNFDQIVTQLS